MMYIKQFFLTLLALFFCAIYVVHSAPAYPEPIDIVEKDGRHLTIRLFGDEVFNYTTTIDLIPISQAKDGFYYYTNYSKNSIARTSIRANNPSQRSVSERQFTGAISSISSLVIESQRESSPMADRYDGEGVYTRTNRNHQRINPTKGLVLLVEFQDVKFSETRAAFNSMLNTQGYIENGATGSAKDYFESSSSGQYSPSFSVYGPYRLSKNRAFYGGDAANGSDLNPRQMILEACRLADKDGVNFREYYAGSDNVLDNVFIYFAGHNEAEGGGSETIWPHKWSVHKYNEVVDGLRLGSYACSSELRSSSGDYMAGIGTFCHEFSHLLDINDFYDTDGYNNGRTRGLGRMSIMSEGTYNNSGRTPPLYNVYERELAGWLELEELPSIAEGKERTLIIKPINKENKGYYIKTDNDDEIFVLEVRDKKYGTWDAYIPKYGLILYQIDKSDNLIGSRSAKKLWGINRVNAHFSHECFRIRANISNNQENPTNFDNIRDWDGYRLSPQNSIYKVETLNDNSIRIFMRNISNDPRFQRQGSKDIEISINYVRQREATMALSFLGNKISQWRVTVRKEDDSDVVTQIFSADDDEYAIDKNLDPNTTYKFIARSVYNKNITGRKEMTFTTLEKTSKYMSIKIDPVRELAYVINASDNIDNIKWMINDIPYNDKKVTLNPDIINSIEAHVTLTDGTEEIIFTEYKFKDEDEE